MLRGFYTAANGIINEQRIINVITNNIANSSTAGYKTETAIPATFAEEMLLMKNGYNNGRHYSGDINYRTFDHTYTNLKDGTYEYTDSRLDFATVGSVFFTVAERRTGEPLLTKNGQFNIDAQGYLALGSSGRVLDDNGNEIQLSTANFTVRRDGTIYVDDGREIRLGLTYLEQNLDIEKVGDNLMRPFEQTPMNNIPVGYEYQVLQGAFERSNVDVSRETIDAMNAQGIFTACSTVLKTVNTVNRIAANDLMKIT